jgi:hypothetical protein
MKNLTLLLFITTIFIAGAALNVSAQNPKKTSSARAAYGLSPAKHKPKKKSKIKSQQRKAREKNPAYRKKYNWAG